MDKWAEIRRLHRAEQVPIKEISRRLGVARNTVRAALVSEAPPEYRRAGKRRKHLVHERFQFGFGLGEFVRIRQDSRLQINRFQRRLTADTPNLTKYY